MKFGVNMFMTDYAMYPDELAREVEARGFESIWFLIRIALTSFRERTAGF